MMDEPEDSGFGDSGDSEAPEKPDNQNRPPSDTHREVAYLRHLVQTQAPVTIKLTSGELLNGYIEYYDRRFLRLTRRDGENLFIFKHNIKYLYETPQEQKSGSSLRG